nr:hypothetical protein [Nitrospiraceae bacterium]
MSRTRQIPIKAALVLIAAIASAGFFLFNSQLALRMLFARFAPEGLSVKKISGTLAGPVRLEGITYSRGANGTRVSIEKLGMDWRLTELMAMDLHITGITVSKMQIKIEQPVKPRPPGPLPSLRLPAFFSITLDKAVARDVEYMPPSPQKPLLLERLSLSAHMRGDILHIRHMEAEAPRYSVSIRGRIKTAGNYQMALRTKWGFAPVGYPRAEGAGDLSGSLKQIHILQTIGPPYNTNIDFTVDGLLPQPGLKPGARPTWKGKVRWRSLQLKVPPAGNKTLNSPRGELATEGSTGAYRFRLDTEIYLKGKALPGRLRAEGSGNMAGLRIESFRAAFPGGQLYGSGSLTLRAGPPEASPLAAKTKTSVGWMFTVAGKGVNPAWVSPKWGGNINFAARISGSIAGVKRNISLDIDSLGGRLRGYPFGGSGRIRITDHDYYIPGIHMRSGSAVMSASGSFVRGRWDLSWDLNAKNLGELLPDAGGSLLARGTFTGRGKPVVKALIT